VIFVYLNGKAVLLIGVDCLHNDFSLSHDIVGVRYPSAPTVDFCKSCFCVFSKVKVLDTIIFQIGLSYQPGSTTSNFMRFDSTIKLTLMQEGKYNKVFFDSLNIQITEAERDKTSENAQLLYARLQQ
jgi:hypothetical protein